MRPIYHQLEQRIEAHIFVAFMAYCLHVTLRARLRALAPGLTPRAVLDKLAAIQMLDVHTGYLSFGGGLENEARRRLYEPEAVSQPRLRRREF